MLQNLKSYFFKEKNWGIWMTKQKFGSWKQKARTESRNLEGSKRYLWKYYYSILLQYKPRENCSIVLILILYQLIVWYQKNILRKISKNSRPLFIICDHLFGCPKANFGPLHW